jgi:hypothetical protein
MRRQLAVPILLSLALFVPELYADPAGTPAATAG